MALVSPPPVVDLTATQKFKLFIEPARTVALNVAVTFVQAFIPAWAIAGFSLDKVALSAAGSAGLSAAWNIVLKPLAKQHGFVKAS